MKRQMKQFVKRLRDQLLGPLLVQQRAQIQMSQLVLVMKYRELLHRGDPLPSFRDVGFSVYSGADEDGVLLYVFALIGSTNRRLVDIGAASIGASNSANLLINHGWTGLLVDSNQESVRGARAHYETNPATRFYPPKIVHAWVTAENVDALLTEHGYAGELDLLMIDIDGVDYWIWKAIKSLSPRVVVVEYQDIISPDLALTVPYRPDFQASDYEVNRTSNDYVGASLLAMVKLGREKGYRLVGCNRYGWNAVFVRNDLSLEFLPEVNTESCLSHPWNEYGRKERFPRVQHMNWVEV